MSQDALRVEALREAASLISGSRDADYGGPYENFGRIAEFWTTAFGRKFSRRDVATALILVKLSRDVGPGIPYKPDTWVDIAGYAGCGYEVGSIEKEKEQQATQTN
jgi:hypothetical protein